MTDRSPKEREHWTAALVPTSNCLSLEELSGYSDGSLPTSIGARVSAHLADCPRCQAELAMLREFELAVLRAEEGSAVNCITTELKRRAGQITGSSQDSRLADRAATGTEPIR